MAERRTPSRASTRSLGTRHPPARREHQRRPLTHRARRALEDPVRQFQVSLLLLLSVLVLGTVGYRSIEGMGWVDAAYMTVITVATVGFEEVSPLSQAGKVFTIGLIVVGVGTVAW